MFWKEQGIKLETFYYDDKDFIEVSFNDYVLQYRKNNYEPILAYIFKYLEKLYETGNLTFKGNMGVVQWRNTAMFKRIISFCGLAKEEHVDFIDILLFKSIFVFWDIVRDQEIKKRHAIGEIQFRNKNFRSISAVTYKKARQ